MSTVPTAVLEAAAPVEETLVPKREVVLEAAAPAEETLVPKRVEMKNGSDTEEEDDDDEEEEGEGEDSTKGLYRGLLETTSPRGGQPADEKEEREEWIRKKFVENLSVELDDSNLTASEQLGLGTSPKAHGHLGGLLAGRIGTNRFVAQYAVDCRAKCRYVKCQSYIETGLLRIGKIPPSIKTGHSCRTHWYHVGCIFKSFQNVCKGTKIITSTDDIERINFVKDPDKEKLREYIRTSNAYMASRHQEHLAAAAKKPLYAPFDIDAAIKEKSTSPHATPRSVVPVTPPAKNKTKTESWLDDLQKFAAENDEFPVTSLPLATVEGFISSTAIEAPPAKKRKFGEELEGIVGLALLQGGNRSGPHQS